MVMVVSFCEFGCSGKTYPEDHRTNTKSSLFSAVSGFFVDQFLSRSLRMSTWDGVFDGCPLYITITGEGSSFQDPRGDV